MNFCAFVARNKPQEVDDFDAAGDGLIPLTFSSCGPSSSFMNLDSKPSQPEQDDSSTPVTVSREDEEPSNITAIIQAADSTAEVYEPVEPAFIQTQQVDFDPTQTSDDLNVTRDDLNMTVHDDLSGTQEEKLEQRISNPFSPASMVPAAPEDDDDDDDL